MKRWYLLYCKRGDQKRAQQHLENQGVECFYPQIEVRKVVRGKKQKVKEPLFPSYLFVCFDYEQGPSFTTVRSTRGVADFIRFGAKPHEVPFDLVFELKELEKCCSEKTEASCIEFQSGQIVTINSGQFAGIEAIFHQKDGEARSIMLVKMISQVVPISIENEALQAHV
ncbi:transcription/translation regulatory transformer protein RfaH [uncultured Vibrio sp.]|uniref:transcription/translation regulatory transformer protein RfaH n=1 Tax=uncultured Vibrio sp. TaxID=114054 RepID=UPI0026221175|nr:transcription/translation regulatory transformer protein RfaH [uncultured Vibrio sp.]